MKVAVFNDTSTARHFGCDAVMKVLRDAIESRGGSIIYKHPTGHAWQEDRAALAAIDDASLVVVNGEGTIHHSRRTARELAALGPYCAARGRAAVLINATIEANDRSTMNDVLAFRAIYVRDTASRSEVEAAGGPSTVVGDLSFGAELPPWSEEATSGVIVVDSTRRAATRALGTIARRLEADLVSMKYADGIAFRPRRWLRGYAMKRRRNIVEIDSFYSFARYLAKHRHLVTGRYHALCFAINMGMPFSAMPSNTGKSEGLVQDAGIDPARIFVGPKTPSFLTLSESEKGAMLRYASATRQRQNGMFDHILRLA
jgi:polysaccharide pyruvyl transferase WcaK-like protein